jgi:hypothetical protein
MTAGDVTGAEAVPGAGAGAPEAEAAGADAADAVGTELGELERVSPPQEIAATKTGRTRRCHVMRATVVARGAFVPASFAPIERPAIDREDARAAGDETGAKLACLEAHDNQASRGIHPKILERVENRGIQKGTQKRPSAIRVASVEQKIAGIMRHEWPMDCARGDQLASCRTHRHCSDTTGMRVA